MKLNITISDLLKSVVVGVFCMVVDPVFATDFAVIGDLPYDDVNGPDEVRLSLSDMKDKDMPFVVHVGDIWGGGDSCATSKYISRKKLFDFPGMPFVYIPGDNEYNDCPDVSAAFSNIQTHMIDSSLSIDGTTLTRQSGRPENVKWVYDKIQFVAVNLPGSNPWDNIDDWADIREDAKTFITSAFDDAANNGAKAIVVLSHANYFNPAVTLGFDYFDSLVNTFGLPVLFVNGDGHSNQFLQPESDRPFWRLETNHEACKWHRVTFDKTTGIFTQVEQNGCVPKTQGR